MNTDELIGKLKKHFKIDFYEEVETLAKERLINAVRIKEKLERYGAIDAIK